MKGLTETEERILTDVLSWQEDLMVMEKERRNIDGMSCRVSVCLTAQDFRWISFDIFSYDNMLLYHRNLDLLKASHEEAVVMYKEMLEEYEKAK